MRLLFLGDVMGRSGRNAVFRELPSLRQKLALDFVVVNGENAAGGVGITEDICRDILAAGADVITLGNHAFDQREALVFIAREDRLLRPMNFPKGTPGRGSYLYTAQNGARVLVANVMGRVFMDALDDPFPAVNAMLEVCPLGAGCDASLIDVHAEASSEKQALGNYVDGRASVVVGTHTHVPTSDARILPHGTAYQTDAGMCGDYDSIIGVEKEEPIRRFLEKTPGSRFEAASGAATLCGLMVETAANGLAVKVGALRMGPGLEEVWPAW